jgi:hypothetical protein
MATTLTTKTGGLKRRLFRSLNDDPRLIDELMPSVKFTGPISDPGPDSHPVKTPG